MIYICSILEDYLQVRINLFKILQVGGNPVFISPCKYENTVLFAAFLYPDSRNNFMGAPFEPYAFV